MDLCGLLLLDKAPGMTSHTAVAILRKILGIEKIGHLGTLDPFATGLLPILIGGATRLSDEMISGKKQYLFTISLGIETDTLDASGKLVEQAEVPLFFEEKINNILPQFIGAIEQVPPVYSALKMNGKPLYEYMRAIGKLPHSIETKKRNVFIDTLEIVSVDRSLKTVTLRVLCEKGTYVRSLARDIAKAINTRGHCTALRREVVAPWSVDDAVSFSQENKLDIALIKRKIISPEQMLPRFSKITLDKMHLKPLSSGNVISLPLEEALSQYPFVSKISLDDNKVFVCMAENEHDSLMFLSDLEINTTEKIVKIKPKKKII